MYSGQVTRNKAAEFAFFGGAAGGIAGARSKARAGTAIGVAAGATIGAIIGSYVTEDTYIVIADVQLGVTEPGQAQKKTTIVFGSGKKKERNERRGFKPFRQLLNTGVAVYAGGRNVAQAGITGGVRQRFASILSDVI